MPSPSKLKTIWKALTKKLHHGGNNRRRPPKGPSMSFYPDFTSTLSRFHPDFIQILSRFYPDYIQILFYFYPYFIQIKKKKKLPNFRYHLNTILIRSGYNLDKRTWTALFCWFCTSSMRIEEE